jgi:hypothetical protein
MSNNLQGKKIGTKGTKMPPEKDNQGRTNDEATPNRHKGRTLNKML